ncbi:MAG: hypothetical protein ABW182_09720 [Sphingomonas sp.]
MTATTHSATAVPTGRSSPLIVVPHVGLALVITVVLIGAWAFRDWGNLALLRLPDNDDMARLAQVRDWLNGQAFNDLTQYRMGPPAGAPMHWSRLADAGPAALILVFRPLLGATGAEIAMAIVYPAILFFLYLMLVARIATRLGGGRSGVPALLLGAIAFPTISLFLPGRIDHHALQIVLTLVLIDTLVGPPDFRRGVIAGIVSALSLSIGLEVAPEVVAAMAAMGLAWLAGGPDEDRRALGFGIAMGGVTLALLASARPMSWPEQWCDGLTPASSRATLALAGAWLLMGLSGRVARDWPIRLATAAILGGGAAILAWQTSSVCFAGPYGALDPFLQHVWMRNVSEARGLFAGQDTIGTSIAYGGLMLAGTALALGRVRTPEWRALAVFMLISAVAAILAIRVTYIMAGVAAIPFAAMLARDGALAKRLALWVVGAGISWNLLAITLDGAFARPLIAAKKVQQLCTAAAPLRVVGAQPAGTIMAPLELDSYLLGLTPHHVVGAVYHRNNAGNLAMYRFFLSPPERAGHQARAQGITYVAICADNLHEDGLAPYRPGSLAEALQAGRIPGWLDPIPTGGAIQLYRVRKSASVAPGPVATRRTAGNIRLPHPPALS